MTALVYAYQHMASRVSAHERFSAIVHGFDRANKKNIVTVCLLGVLMLGALLYLGALYGIFFSGFQIQSENRRIAELAKANDELELNIQRVTASFPARHKETLSSMEKISEVRYVTGAGVAVSYIP